MSNEKAFELQVLINRLFEFKKSHKLTLQEIADGTGVQKSYVYKLLKLDAHPSIKYTLSLSRFMNIPLFSMFLPTDQEIKAEFIKRVNMKIAEQNYSLEELSKITDINYLKLTDILNGKIVPTNDEVSSLDKIFHISEDYMYITEEDIDKIHISILKNKGLNDEQIKTVQDYIKSLAK